MTKRKETKNSLTYTTRGLSIGKYRFQCRETYEDMLKEHLINTYDVSPEAREQHDLEAEFNKEGKRIKATREEIAAYWSNVLKRK